MTILIHVLFFYLWILFNRIAVHNNQFEIMLMEYPILHHRTGFITMIFLFVFENNESGKFAVHVGVHGHCWTLASVSA